MSIDTEEVRALVEAASRGPWALESAGIMDAHRSRVVVITASTPDAQDEADARFIVEARALVPALCDELDATREERDELREAEREAVESAHREIDRIRSIAKAEVARLTQARDSLAWQVYALDGYRQAAEARAEQYRQALARATPWVEYVAKVIAVDWAPAEEAAAERDLECCRAALAAGAPDEREV